LAEGATDRLTGSNGLTPIVMEFEVAGLPVTHDLLEVSTQLITSFAKGV